MIEKTYDNRMEIADLPGGLQDGLVYSNTDLASMLFCCMRDRAYVSTLRKIFDTDPCRKFGMAQFGNPL